MQTQKQLAAETLAAHRQRLEELDRARRQAGVPPAQPLAPALWKLYDPQHPTGRQIYDSYTDAELLDFMLETMNRPGHKPRWDQIFYIHQVYIKQRFGNDHTATQRARNRRKRLADQVKWPPDWPERVSLEPAAEWAASRKRPFSGRETARLQQFCHEVQTKRSPPQEEGIPEDVKRLFRTRGCTWQKGLELMGIPVLNRIALKHLKGYWRQSSQTMTATE